jgi:DNA-binding transcriptional MerR regulator
MASKGPEAFRTISEVADDLDLPQHVLRFWETRFTQIRPMKRGGGRRYYRPEDVDLLRGIRYLLYGEGYTIRGVQRILKEQGPRSVVGAMRGQVPVVVANDDEEPEAEGTDAEVLDDLEFEDEAPAGVGDEHVEPTFDPREFRSERAAATNGSAASRARVFTDEDRRRLESTLSDLLDLKRTLDQARG